MALQPDSPSWSSAVCSRGTSGPDIGQWIVANGHALDQSQYSKA